MRLSWIMLWMVALAGGAGAMPEPPPPEGFAAAQYIDGAGCVFLREGGGWTARLDRQGAMVCGFPPTLSQRGLPPMPEPAPPPTVEEILFQQLAAGLRDGEFAADPTPLAERPVFSAARGASPVERDLQALISGQDMLRAAMAGPPAGDGLCELLGYVPDPSAGALLGADVTRGLCPGMRPVVPAPILTAGARAGPPPAAAGNMARPALKPEAAPAQRAAAVPAPGPKAARPERRQQASSPAPAKAAAAAEMIPPHARYVQLGAFGQQAAQSTARRLAGQGYPVVQSRASDDEERTRVLMVGPFKDRQSLVRALNELRARGHPGAVAR